MYNIIFNADTLNKDLKCSQEVVALTEMALDFFEKKRLPITEDMLVEEEYRYRVKDIMQNVFEIDANNKLVGVKFPRYLQNDEIIAPKIQKMFSDYIEGKDYEELEAKHKKMGHFQYIKREENPFKIIIQGIVTSLTRPPYNLKCHYRNIDGQFYFVVGSWRKRK